MREILPQLLSRIDQGETVVYCRLVETRGSTPQKAGAGMLVFGDGSQVGTLGGGCVEAEVRKRALALFAQAENQAPAEIAKFQLDSDYGWDDGLICGGRMSILLAPLGKRNLPAYFVELSKLLRKGAALTEAIVFDESASGTKAATSFLFDEDGRAVASWPDDSEAKAATEAVQADLHSLKNRPRPYVVSGVSYLPQFARCPLLIVGGGHVGAAVARLAAKLEFEISVTDDREDIVSEARFPDAVSRLAGSVSQVLPAFEVTSNTYCLIVTRGHNHDEEALFHLANRGAAYIGLIGSRRKIRLIFDDLLDQGIPPAALESVFAPVGLDIGSQTVDEIAVSIAAELVAHRNLNGKVPARPQPVNVPSVKCQSREQ